MISQGDGAPLPSAIHPQYNRLLDLPSTSHFDNPSPDSYNLDLSIDPQDYGNPLSSLAISRDPSLFTGGDNQSFAPGPAAMAFNAWPPTYSHSFSQYHYPLQHISDDKLQSIESAAVEFPTIGLIPMIFSNTFTSEQLIEDANDQSQRNLFSEGTSAKPNSPTSLHRQVHTNPLNTCQDCLTTFPTQTALSTHAIQTQHSPYLCACGKTFSRLDVLTRHIQSSATQSNSTYPCPHCKKHRGDNAFRRLDHLTQHLRGYHNHEVSTGSDDSEDATIEPASRRKIPSCSFHGCEMLFGSRSEFTKHMREVHDESLYPCSENGCLRVGGKGFFRQKDLIRHQGDHHSQSS